MWYHQEVEDSNRYGDESSIGERSAEEAMEKGKQAKVVIACADPYEIFRMSTSNDNSEWKSRMKSPKSKDKGHKSDIRLSKQDSEVAVRDLQIDIPDENAIVKDVKTDQDGGPPVLHNENIHVETAMETAHIKRYHHLNSGRIRCCEQWNCGCGCPCGCSSGGWQRFIMNRPKKFPKQSGVLDIV